MIDRYPLDLTNKRYIALEIRKLLYTESCKDLLWLIDNMTDEDLDSIIRREYRLSYDHKTYIDELLASNRTQSHIIVNEKKHFFDRILRGLNTNKYELGI